MSIGYCSATVLFSFSCSGEGCEYILIWRRTPHHLFIHVPAPMALGGKYGQASDDQTPTDFSPDDDLRFCVFRAHVFVRRGGRNPSVNEKVTIMNTGTLRRPAVWCQFFGGLHPPRCG